MAEKLTTETIVKALRCASLVDSCPVFPCDEKCPYFYIDLCVAEDQHIWAAQAADKIEELTKHENTILLADDGERYTADGLKGLIEEKRNLLQACEEHRQEMVQLRDDRDEWKHRAEVAENCINQIHYYVSADTADGSPFRRFANHIFRIMNEWRDPHNKDGGENE